MNSGFNSGRKGLITSVVGIVLAIAAVIAYIVLFSAPQAKAEPERLIVSLGEKISAADLKEKGFIKNDFGFSLALRGRGIEPGGYRISKAMSAWELADTLAGEPYMKWVVIPEGLRKEEIADILAAKLNWSNEEKSEWIKDYTAAQSDYFEGVYFPDTYLIPVDEAPAAVADRLRAKFNEKFAPYAKEALAQDIKWVTLLKISSIIQREAAGKNDMPIISGVLWNRLLKKMRLEVDATLQYARGDVGQGWWAPISVADKQIDSPYNTYKYSGLPPYPIANPGISAIDAALHPAKTECLFYLHDSAKAIHCAKTYEEHLANIEKYLR